VKRATARFNSQNARESAPPPLCQAVRKPLRFPRQALSSESIRLSRRAMYRQVRSELIARLRPPYGDALRDMPRSRLKD
jgi:hypothetical protein